MPRELVMYGALIASSLPFWVAGAVSEARLLPGLPLSALMFVCPALSACLVFAATGRKADIAATARRFLPLGPGGPTLALTFLVMPLLCLVSYLADYGPRGLALLELPGPWSLLILSAAFLASAFGEEYLWTGVYLVDISERTRWKYSLLVPLAYAGWHALPFFQIGHPLRWILGQIAFSFVFRLLILGILRLAGYRSIVAVYLHAGYNVAWQLYPQATATYDPWPLALVTALAAVGVELVARRRAAGAQRDARGATGKYTE